LWQDDYSKLGLCVEQMGTDPSTGICFADCTSSAPISWPGAVVVRADVQSYLDSASKRGMASSIGSQGLFLNFERWDGHDANESIYYIPNNMKQVHPSCVIFRKLAIKMGYKPAQKKESFNEKYHNETSGITKDGHCIPPINKKNVKDWPDILIRHHHIFKELVGNGVEFDGVPDKSCHHMVEHMFAIDWSFGNENNNKIFANKYGSSLCRARDLILLTKIMLEPRNTNGNRPITGLKVGKICAWNPAHARPNLMVYGCEFNVSQIYLGTRVGITAFNRKRKE
jgi:hypothetical protein